MSAEFQYEIRLDEIVRASIGGVTRVEGAIQLERPPQEVCDGLYFPTPEPLQHLLVPSDSGEIRLELHCDWLDMRTAKHWDTREMETTPD